MILRTSSQRTNTQTTPETTHTHTQIHRAMMCMQEHKMYFIVVVVLMSLRNDAVFILFFCKKTGVANVGDDANSNSTWYYVGATLGAVVLVLIIVVVVLGVKSCQKQNDVAMLAGNQAYVRGSCSQIF